MTVPATDAAPPDVPDVFDPRGYADGLPHTAYRLLRDHHPVAWQEEHEVLGWPAGPGFWAVTRHDDVVRVLKDARTFSSHLGATQIRDPDPADLPFIRRMMLNQDPPDHGRLRRLVSRAFTPRRVERFGTAVRERARALLDRGGRRGAYGERGARPRHRRHRRLRPAQPRRSARGAAHRTRAAAGTGPGGSSATRTRTKRARRHRGRTGRPADPRSPSMLQDMFDYARELAAHKRRHPGDDVMTVLASDDELATPELEMFFFLLTIAGNDTVRSAAPGGLLALARHPDAVPRGCAAGRWRTATCVEELLRWHPPVLTFRRTAARDTELAGRRIRAGDKVVVFHGSANYDERVFAAPHRLDLARSPNPHVSFGDGPHVCLGAHFARLQLRVLYEETLRSLLPALAVAGPPQRLVSNFINGLKSLPLRLVDGSPR